MWWSLTVSINFLDTVLASWQGFRTSSSNLVIIYTTCLFVCFLFFWFLFSFEPWAVQYFDINFSILNFKRCTVKIVMSNFHFYKTLLYSMTLFASSLMEIHNHTSYISMLIVNVVDKLITICFLYDRVHKVHQETLADLDLAEER